jgi:hypothetical protein
MAEVKSLAMGAPLVRKRISATEDGSMMKGHDVDEGTSGFCRSIIMYIFFIR